MIRKTYIFFGALVAVFIFSSCKKEVYTTQPEEVISKNSKIIVKTNPAGALIYLNGKNMGIKSPDSLIWLKPGAYDLLIKYSPFPDKAQKIFISDTTRYIYNYDYFSDPTNLGSLFISSIPSSANVYINDSLITQKTPVTLASLIPGSYKVKVQFPQFRSDSSITIVSSNKTQTLNFTLEDTTKWISYSIKNSPIGSNSITVLTTDKFNNFWIGTTEGLLTMYNPTRYLLPFETEKNRWTSINMGCRINCITIDDDNNLWIGTNSDLQFYDGIKMIKYSRYLPEGASVNSIGIDNNKRIWVCTTLGILVNDSGNWRLLTKESDYALLDNDNRTITFDAVGKMWLGTINGIQVRNSYSYFTNFLSSNMNLGRNISNYIQDIITDKNGTIWVAHKSGSVKGGITKYNGNNWSFLELPGSYNVLNVQINRIYIDKKNYKWFCTNDGLFRYSDSNEWIYFTTSNSNLPASQVTDCYIDNTGNLWITTLGGGMTKLKKGNF